MRSFGCNKYSSQRLNIIYIFFVLIVTHVGNRLFTKNCRTKMLLTSWQRKPVLFFSEKFRYVSKMPFRVSVVKRCMRNIHSFLYKHSVYPVKTHLTLNPFRLSCVMERDVSPGHDKSSCSRIFKKCQLHCA